MYTVNESALVKRVNRKLAHNGERLRRGRDPQTHVRCYLVIDTDINGVLGTVHDIETYARELGVLYGGERFSPREEL